MRHYDKALYVGNLCENLACDWILGKWGQGHDK